MPIIFLNVNKTRHLLFFCRPVAYGGNTYSTKLLLLTNHTPYFSYRRCSPYRWVFLYPLICVPSIHNDSS